MLGFLAMTEGKVRVDIATDYEGGEHSSSMEFESNKLPRVGDVICVEIEGRQRQIRITEVFGSVVSQSPGPPRKILHAKIADS